MKNFKEQLKERQVTLISEQKIFEGVKGGGLFRGRPYDHILVKGEYNLYRGIRNDVINYFKENSIQFWGGENVTGNTLSSQVSCLNHLFAIRNNSEAVKAVMQGFVGDKLNIDRMKIVPGDCFNPQYISFETISKDDYMNEGKLTRGSNNTSIDALAVAVDNSGKEVLLVIEWKLVEDDSGNMAPLNESEKEYSSGLTRIKRYSDLLNESSSISDNEKVKNYQDSKLFHLPFYELMRQTIWAEQVCNNKDFDPEDYLHILVLPEQNDMNCKEYQCFKGNKEAVGIPGCWPLLLSDEGKKRFVVANPKSVVDSLKDMCEYNNLVNYLTERYYN